MKIEKSFKDEPMKPIDQAIYWVEYVIRHGGAEHLKSDSIGLNDLQFFLFDMSLVFLVSTGLIAWICYLVVSKIT